MTKVHQISAHVRRVTAPKFLAALPGWLVWKYEYEEQNVKPRKMPYYVSGGRRQGSQGSLDDRKKLVTFEEAKDAAAKGGFDGVGLATLPGFNVTALDFDNCVVDGVVNKEVQSICGESYCEYSPSGEGVRAFFKGSGLGNHKDIKDKSIYGFEVFSTKGFVTFTGNLLPICDLVGGEDTVSEITKAVRGLCDRRFGRDRNTLSVSSVDPLGMTDEQIADCLAALPSDMGHDDWLHIGMAIHHETDGEGFHLWDEWSAQSTKYPGSDTLARRWDSFAGEVSGPRITAKTLMKMAGEFGVRVDLPIATLDDFQVVVVTPSTQGPLPSFERTPTGRIISNFVNVCKAVGSPAALGWKFGYDAFRDELVISKDPALLGWGYMDKEDYSRIRIRLHEIGINDPKEENVKRAVDLAAKENTFDSALIWINSLKWDGVPRVEQFMTTYMGVEDCPYSRSVAMYMWTALAGRVYQPGCKADIAPIFVGPQGCGKSRAVMAIAPNPNFYCELSLTEDEANLSRKMKGRVVAELAELKGLSNKDLQHTKAFISRQSENWIPKYQELEQTYLRRLLFIGTSNESEFLDDESGERRWSPINVGEVDSDAITRDCEQLWAEAFLLFTADGIQFKEVEKLAREAHKDFKVVDEWSTAVQNWLNEDGGFGTGKPGDRRFVKSHDVLTLAIKMPIERVNRSHRNRVSKVLKSLGYVSQTVREGSVPIKAFVRKDL